jgi:hypothetical protein
MTRLNLLLVVIVVFGHSAWAQQFLWVKKVETQARSKIVDLSTDPTGNIYAAGTFAGPEAKLDHLTLTPPQVPPMSSGYGSSFLAKYDATGKIIWAKGFFANVPASARNASDVEVSAVKTFGTASVYVTGSFVDHATFDQFSIRSRGRNLFLAKYSSDGSCLWVQHSSTDQWVWGHNLALDKHGNAYVVGSYWPNVTIDGKQLDELSNSAAVEQLYTFVLKCSSNGKITWLKKMGGVNVFTGTGIAIDQDENLYLTSSFREELRLPPLAPLAYQSPPGATIYRTFVAKLDSMGNGLWAVDLGAGLRGYLGPSNSELKLDKAGNLYMASWGIGNTGTGFLLVFGPNGETAWVKSATPLLLSNSNQPAMASQLAVTDELINTTVYIRSPTLLDGRRVDANMLADKTVLLQYTNTGDLHNLVEVNHQGSFLALEPSPDGSLYLGGTTDCFFSQTVSAPCRLYMQDAYLIKFGHGAPTQESFDACQIRPKLENFANMPTALSTSLQQDVRRLATHYIPGAVYEWYLDENRLNVPSDFQLLVPIAQRGRYHVVIRQASGCSWKTNEVTIDPRDYLNTPLARPEDELARQVLVFPNPFVDRLSLSLGTGLVAGNLGIQLTDVLGQSLPCNPSPRTDQQIELPLNHLPKGVYLIKFIYRGRSFVKKVTKQ